MPDELLEKVLRCAIDVDDGWWTGQRRELVGVLPLVCKKLVAQLRRLKLPVAHVEVSNAEDARQRANEAGRAWDLVSCTLIRGLSGGGMGEVSALAGCAALRVLDMSDCEVKDVSGLAGCAALHTLEMNMCT